MSWRSVTAIVGGFAATALLSIATDAIMHTTGVFPPSGQPMNGGLFVWATTYRVIYTVIGGYVTAMMAPRRPMRHVLVLGSIGIAAATAGTVVTWNRGPEFGPKWYPILLVISALPCVWV